MTDPAPARGLRRHQRVSIAARPVVWPTDCPNMNELDIQLFHWLNARPDAAPWLLDAARVITRHLSSAALLALLPMAFVNRRTRWQVLGVLLTFALAWLVARGMREGIPSVRPFAMGLGFQGLPHSDNAGFPSMHATMASAWAAGLCFFAAGRNRPLWLAVTVPVALSIAWSRVYLGLHFPFDMGAGLLLGLLCGALAYALLERSALGRPLRVRWHPAPRPEDGAGLTKPGRS